jgi:hypothetical protein
MTIGVVAFFLASAVGSLVDHTFVEDDAVPASVAAFSEARTGPRVDPALTHAAMFRLRREGARFPRRPAVRGRS